ncbi:uncharacterized protein LOC144481673 isoform X2 [Mustelus asterias]
MLPQLGKQAAAMATRRHHSHKQARPRWQGRAVRVLLLLATLSTEVKTDPPPGAIQRECRDRYFYTWIDRNFLSTRKWSIDASDDSGNKFPLTPRFAAMCGFNLGSDKWGNLEIRTSFLGCLVQNDNDDTFSLNIHLNIEHKSIPGFFTTHSFSMTCGLGYQWSSREIVCEENYMEVSVRRLFPGIAEEQMEIEDWEAVIPAAQEAITSVWQIVFQVTDGEVTQLKTMTTTQAHSFGYGVNTTASRVVFRAPYNSNESSIIMIDNMPVESIKATVFYKQRWLILLVDSSTACPIGPAILQDNKLIWPTPRVLDPLVFPANMTADMVVMGIDGKFLDDNTLEQRGYDLYINISVIAIVIPVGAEGGVSKSHVLNNTYGIVYSIHLLLEHQWLDQLQELTQHRVYHLASTPFIPEVPSVIDADTTRPKKHFNVTVGPFLPDVEILSIGVANRNLSVDDLKKHGYNIYPVANPNGTIGFTVVVDVGAPFIKQQYLHDDIRRYTMNLTLIFNILPDDEVFTIPVIIITDVHDVVLPVLTGYCGDTALYLMMKHGNLDHYWLPYVADELLSFELAQTYGYMTMENGTHFYLAVPSSAPGVVHEEISLHDLQVKIDFSLKDNQTLEVYSNFTVRCTFSIPQEEVLVCFQNGTVAVTIKSTVTLPDIDVRRLVLRDPTCGPKEQDGTKALFVFDINSCGTIGRFMKDYIIYENEISYQKERIPLDHPVITRDPDYRCENNMETYKTIFHPVATRNVKNPFSLKRFEVKTFASNNSGGLQGLVYFHCNVAVCDMNNPDIPCGRRCTTGKRGGRTINHSAQEFQSAVSSGPIHILPEVNQSPDHKTSEGTPWKLSWVVLLAVGAAVLGSVLLLAVVYVIKSRRHY